MAFNLLHLKLFAMLNKAEPWESADKDVSYGVCLFVCLSRVLVCLTTEKGLMWGLKISYLVCIWNFGRLILVSFLPT